MNTTHSPTWIQIIAAIPAAVMLVILFCWNPKSKKQWSLAATIAAYVALYYFLFVR